MVLDGLEQQKRERLRTAASDDLLTARAEWVAVLELATEIKRVGEYYDPAKRRDKYPIASR